MPIFFAAMRYASLPQSSAGEPARYRRFTVNRTHPPALAKEGV